MKSEIKIGDVVKYLPNDPASWIGVVKEIILSNDETKRRGYSGDVYIIQDPFSTVSISTRKENLFKMTSYYCRIKKSGDNYQPQIKRKSILSFLFPYEAVCCPVEKTEFSCDGDYVYYWTKSREKSVKIIEEKLKGFNLIWKKDISY